MNNKPKTKNLEKLLSYENEIFIYNCYLSILDRSPDPAGMLYYLKRIRSGVSKIEIISQLRKSPEGKSHQIIVDGLDEAVKKYKRSQISKFITLRILLDLVRHRGSTKTNSIHIDANSDERFDEPSGEGDIAFELRPTNQLQLNNDDKCSWNSLGTDPYFYLMTPNTNKLAAGWYKVDLAIASENKHNFAKFYLDTGNGFNETETVIVPYGKSENVTRIFKTEKPILIIRFDPLEDIGSFQVVSLKLLSISSKQATEEMYERIVAKHADYKSINKEDVVTLVSATASIEQQSIIKYLSILYSKTYRSLQFSIGYEDWIEEIETPNLPESSVCIATIEKMNEKPLISVLVPVFNTPDEYLRECINSVIAQSYPHWELCIADDASTDSSVRATLEEFKRIDPRIHVVYREKNGHISKTSNSALKIATGEFVALLDHDDLLATNALYFIAVAINERTDAQILYSDEDKLNSEGVRYEPHFKSDWNPDLFFSQNYVSHLGVFKRELLTQIDGFRSGVEGSQDQDLLLRCLPFIAAEQIIHIPRVLYHWRAADGSTALRPGEKNYTTLAGIKSLTDYFKENGPAGVQVLEGMASNTYHIKYPLPVPNPVVSLLIPTRDRLHLVETCVRSILTKSTYRNFEIIILDNGSIEPDTLSFFKTIQSEDSRVKVLRYDHPFNYSAINNFGVQNSKGTLIGLINNDIEVISSEWLTEMVRHVSRPEVGCVGAKLYFEDDTVQHGGVICSLGGVAGHSHKYFPRNNVGYFHRLVLTQSLSAVTAACLLVRREVYDQVAGLDEINLKVAFNDVDFCLKVREAGYRNLWTPYAELYHYESISRGTEDTPEKLARFQSEVAFMQNKWGSALKYDPYYNPNLTKDREDFSINSYTSN